MMFDWYKNWISRRHETAMSPYHRVIRHPFTHLGAVIGIIILAFIFFGTGWIAANCYSYPINHHVTLASKNENIWYSHYCIYETKYGCMAYSNDKHDDFHLIYNDSYDRIVGKPEWDATPIGSNYTYVTTAVACR